MADLYRSLLEKRDALKAEGDSIHAAASEAGDYTPEQLERMEALDTEMAEVTRSVTAEEKRRSWQATAPAVDVATEDNPISAPAESHEAPTPFRSLGEQMLAVRNMSLGKASDLEHNKLAAVMDFWNREAAILGASETVPADGGFLVQQDQTNSLLSLAHQTGVLAQRCRRVPIGANANGLKANLIDETSRANGSRFGAVQVYREAEGDPTTSGRPKFRQIDLTLAKMMGLFYATDEILRDQTALTAIARQGFQEEFGFRLDDEIYDGSGAGEIEGFQNSGALITVPEETSQANDSLVVENVWKMWTRMTPASRSKAVWLVNNDVWPEILALNSIADGSGTLVFQPPGSGLASITQAPEGTLLGRPIVTIEQAATLGDAGDVSFVDLDQFMLIEKAGVEEATSIHVEFLTAQQVWRWVVRNNGQTIPRVPLTPAKGTTTTSPFVTLGERAT